MKARKDRQLQIRVTARQKDMLREAARNAGMDLSEWVLSRLDLHRRVAFQALLNYLRTESDQVYPLSAINDFLSKLAPMEFQLLFAEPISLGISDYWDNYLAAMIEHAAKLKGIGSPAWLKAIKPLSKPVFGSQLKELRLHLLVSSPIAFRKRNIFIDSSIGARV